MKKVHSAPRSRFRKMRLDLILLRAYWHWLVFWPAFACIAIGLMVMFNQHRGQDDMKATNETALSDVAALSSAYSRQLARSIEKLDELTLYVKHDWETFGGAIDLQKLHALGLFSTKHFASFVIIGADGLIKTATRDEVVARSVADRPYFQFHQSHLDNVLRVGAVEIGRGSGKPVIQVTRRLNRPDGEFDGVLLVSIANDFFNSITDATKFRHETFQALIGDDDVIRVALTGGQLQARGAEILKLRPDCLPTSAPALVSTACFTDGLARFVSVTHLDDYPFRAIVALSANEVFAQPMQVITHRRHLLLIVALVIASFCLLAMVLSASLLLKREEAAEIRKAYRMATENGRDGFLLFRQVRDKGGVVIDFRVVDCNERAAELYATTKKMLLGTTLNDHYGGKKEYLDQAVTRYCAMFEQGHGEEEYRPPAYSPIKAEWIHRKYVRTFEGLAITLRDVGEKVAHRQEMERLATEDGLTGLPNRHWLGNFLPGMLQRAGFDHEKMAVLFVDLDDFKHVNDAFGHSAGDELLKAAAKRLKSLMRPGDSVARIGGDEFTLILERITADQQVADVAARVVQAFREPFVLHSGKSIVGTSIGIALYPRDGIDSESLLKNADIAMYAAKEAKGNFCFYSTELYKRQLGKVTMEQELAQALVRDEFEIYYQPRLATSTGRMVGMEALIRWNHPERGMISPVEFIPIAEASDLIVQIGETVAHKVVHQIKAWSDAGLPIVPVSINVSPRQFNQGSVPDLVLECLAESGISSHLLEVEITESAMMGDDEQIILQLATLDKMGIKTHVDDFGTGYSSLALLQRLSLDVLKIDRAFTAEIGIKPESQILIRAIISMAHALGMIVVAEGVETQQQLAVLRALACDEIQGFLISKPLCVADAVKALEADQRDDDQSWRAQLWSAIA